VIGLFAATTAGRRAAGDLASRLGSQAVLVDGPIAPSLRRLWDQLDAAVFFLGTGAAVRLVAPLLRDVHTDPGVVAVDEEGRFAVALTGEHSGGANALAAQVADVLGCQAVVTSAADRAGSTPLDEVMDLLAATVDGDLAACGAAILDGAPVLLVNPWGFPLPALPDNVNTDMDEPLWTVVLDDRRPRQDEPERTVRLIPRSLVVGIGASRDVSRTEVIEVAARLDREHGLDPRAIRAFATVDVKAEEPGIVEAAQDLGFWYSPEAGEEIPLLHYPAGTLAEVEVLHPGQAALDAVGTPSVAEASALHAARELGRGARAELVVPKIKGAAVTVAAARIVPRGRLALVGLGPGEADLRVPRADAELRRAEVVIGAESHLAPLRPVLRDGTSMRPGTAEDAITLAASGRAVALVGYRHADLAAEVAALDGCSRDVEIVHVPSVSTSG
jgi:cobalt-precorrin 5A hydrolase/precorrin-3B C17-methyltransferase